MNTIPLKVVIKLLARGLNNIISKSVKDIESSRAILPNNIVASIKSDKAKQADKSLISVELSTTNGDIFFVNEVWKDFFGNSGRANWTDWQVQEHAVKLESHSAPPADFFIPFGAGWLNGPKRARFGENRLAPEKSKYSRVFGYASHAVTIEGLSFVLSLYVEQTDTARDESDLNLSLQAASTLLDGIYRSSEDRTKRLFYKSEPLRNVGGDFIFYRKHGKDNCQFDLLVVGDCANKGMSAALQNALVGSALNRYVDDVSADSWRAHNVLTGIDNAMCQLVRPRNGAAATPSTPENLALSDMGADAAAIVINHWTRTLHYASAQLPIYFVMQDQKGYCVNKFGDHGDGKNLGPARLKGSPPSDEPPQLALGSEGRPLDGVLFTIICTDGFEAALESRQKQDKLPSIEKLIEQIIYSIASPSAELVGNALWEIYDQGKSDVIRRDDAALAVLDSRGD